MIGKFSSDDRIQVQVGASVGDEEAATVSPQQSTVQAPITMDGGYTFDTIEHNGIWPADVEAIPASAAIYARSGSVQLPFDSGSGFGQCRGDLFGATGVAGLPARRSATTAWMGDFDQVHQRWNRVLGRLVPISNGHPDE